MRPWRDALGAVAISLLFAGTSHGEPLAVRVINASKPTQCAETDNVYLKLTSRATRRFTIEARDQHGNLANYPPLDRVKYDFKVTVSGPGAVRAPIGMHVQLILASAPCRAHTRKAA